MGRPRMLGGAGGGIDPIAEEPHHHARSPADGGLGLGPDPAALACAISAEACAVLAIMRRGLRHPRATAADDAMAEHPLVTSLHALRRGARPPRPRSGTSMSAPQSTPASASSTRPRPRASSCSGSRATRCTSSSAASSRASQRYAVLMELTLLSNQRWVAWM
ncbi:uncharacterized protein [Miscanthus floridulus]|uniref:uncharacterized protein n=1 Tax=Miscanthus floridulus TaxID=154761 RepID=UPI003457AC4D